MGQNTGISIFCMTSTTLAKTWIGLVYFILETTKHKLQESVPVLCWYFFNLNEITIVKKENVSSFLLAKRYKINFYHLFLSRVCSAKREQFV